MNVATNSGNLLDKPCMWGDSPNMRSSGSGMVSERPSPDVFADSMGEKKFVEILVKNPASGITHGKTVDPGRVETRNPPNENQQGFRLMWSCC